jgi:hemoglobin-like flavoprotein
MALQPEVLRESLGVVVEREAQITPHFYERLFRRYPQVRPLFSQRESGKQAQMLQEAIVAVVDHLEDGAWLQQTLEGMGKQHVDYGVEDHMYPWVKECLLETLEDLGGAAWQPAWTEAWDAALDAVAGLMLAGAAKQRAQGAAKR